MVKPNADSLIFTCEHGGNRVPRALAAAFGPIRATLRTHRGWDPGALVLARQMATGLHAPLFACTVSRLVVDLNRSETHPRVFSRITATMPDPRRKQLLRELYRPFRKTVAASIDRRVSKGRGVVHVSVHSFTPVLRGVRREADIGLLYDPRRPRERAFAAAWRDAIHRLRPGIRVRMNYPYRGSSDGHTTSLRGGFPADRYVGIELEVNQAIVRAGGPKWADTRAVLTLALTVAMGREPLKTV